MLDKDLYLLICHDQDDTHIIKFQNKNGFISQIRRIALTRLKKLELKEKELLNVGNTESYGENRYYQDTELTAIGIEALKKTIQKLDNKKD